MKRSAGMLLWRRRPAGDIEVLLAHPGRPVLRQKDDAHWTIPKGECEPGEDELAAARREFTEELGIPVPPGDPVPLGEVKQGSSKVNVVWALEADPGEFEVRSNHFDMEWPPRSGKRARISRGRPGRLVSAGRRRGQTLRLAAAVPCPARCSWPSPQAETDDAFRTPEQVTLTQQHAETSREPRARPRSRRPRR